MRAKYYTEEDVLRQQLAHAQAEIMVGSLLFETTHDKQQPFWLYTLQAAPRKFPSKVGKQQYPVQCAAHTASYAPSMSISCSTRRTF